METSLVGVELLNDLEKKNTVYEDEIRKKIRYVLINSYLTDTRNKINLRESSKNNSC
jgi:hypothetical protein